jgi:hypothetical protein
MPRSSVVATWSTIAAWYVANFMSIDSPVQYWSLDRRLVTHTYTNVYAAVNDLSQGQHFSNLRSEDCLVPVPTTKWGHCSAILPLYRVHGCMRSPNSIDLAKRSSLMSSLDPRSYSSARSGRSRSASSVVMIRLRCRR